MEDSHAVLKLGVSDIAGGSRTFQFGGRLTF
jgi:hypothetical protein